MIFENDDGEDGLGSHEIFLGTLIALSHHPSYNQGANSTRKVSRGVIEIGKELGKNG